MYTMLKKTVVTINCYWGSKTFCFCASACKKVKGLLSGSILKCPLTLPPRNIQVWLLKSALGFSVHISQQCPTVYPFILLGKEKQWRLSTLL